MRLVWSRNAFNRAIIIFIITIIIIMVIIVIMVIMVILTPLACTGCICNVPRGPLTVLLSLPMRLLPS